MTVEKKALALVKKARQFCTHITIGDEIARQMADELERTIERERAAIEAHEADKKAFSDAAVKAVKDLKDWMSYYPDTDDIATLGVIAALSPFILPEPDPLVDPLVEARRQIADRVLRQFGAPASDEDCIGLIVAALEEQAKSERIEQ